MNNKKVFFILPLILCILCLTGCGNNECEEWETVEKLDCEYYKEHFNNLAYQNCKEHNKNAGNQKCIKWRD